MAQVGRPPIWTDPEAFSKKVDEYFETQNPITWSGLALYLGFESRQSLEDYKSKPEFSYPIKKALLRIEQMYEGNISKNNPAGAIFALKNFGWKDKQEIDQKTEHSGGITISWEEPDLSPGQGQGTASEL